MEKPKLCVKKLVSCDQASQWAGKDASFAILDTCILLCLGPSGTPCLWKELSCFLNLSLRLRCLSPHSKGSLFHHAFLGRRRPDSSVGPLLSEGNMPRERSCVALVGFFRIRRAFVTVVFNDHLHILVTYKMVGTLHNIGNTSLSQHEESGDPAISIGGLCVFQPQ